MTRQLTNITLGADPEVFFIDGEKTVSAEGLLGGTKGEPKAISEVGHSIQEDNVLAEFNIPPSKTKEDFRENINYCMDYIREVARVNNFDLGTGASAILEDEYLQSDQARAFSCERDFNAHTKTANPIINNNTNLRSAGGHIHIGYDNPDESVSEELILLMDIILGVPALFIDKDTRRRELYGKAGCFRFKSFGVEYRTLSNFWIHDNDLIDWVYESTHKVIDLYNKGLSKQILSKFSRKAHKAIDTYDLELAKTIVNGVEEIITEFNKQKQLQ